MMGVIGEDPKGLGLWVKAMAEYTLVRKPNVGQGSANWNEGQTQWSTPDTFNFLGALRVLWGLGHHGRRLRRA